MSLFQPVVGHHMHVNNNMFRAQNGTAYPQGIQVDYLSVWRLFTSILTLVRRIIFPPLFSFKHRLRLFGVSMLCQNHF